MATYAMAAPNHYKTNISSTSTTEPIELSSKLNQMHLKDRQQKHNEYVESNIPRRQPTIVCEDIADDIDIENDSFDSQEQALEANVCIDQSNEGSLQRSASTASLTVPQHMSEHEVEKRRPPLPSEEPTQEQMLIESNESPNSS